MWWSLNVKEITATDMILFQPSISNTPWWSYFLHRNLFYTFSLKKPISLGLLWSDTRIKLLLHILSRFEIWAFDYITKTVKDRQDFFYVLRSVKAAFLHKIMWPILTTNSNIDKDWNSKNCMIVYLDNRNMIWPCNKTAELRWRI